MANYSQYNNLELPVSTERYSIEVFNKNNRIIDEELHRLDEKNKEQDDDLNSHKSDNENPHNVTKSQLGLDNVENKSSEQIRDELTSDNITNALGYTPYTPAEIDNKLSTLETKYDDANSIKHTHANKSVLDGITDEFVSSLHNLIDERTQKGDSSSAIFIGENSPDIASTIQVWIDTSNTPAILKYRTSITSESWETLGSVWN